MRSYFMDVPHLILDAGVRQRGVHLQHVLADRGQRVRLRRRAHLRQPQGRHLLRVQRLHVSEGRCMQLHSRMSNRVNSGVISGSGGNSQSPSNCLIPGSGGNFVNMFGNMSMVG